MKSILRICALLSPWFAGLSLGLLTASLFFGASEAASNIGFAFLLPVLVDNFARLPRFKKSVAGIYDD